MLCLRKHRSVWREGSIARADVVTMTPVGTLTPLGQWRPSDTDRPSAPVGDVLRQQASAFARLPARVLWKLSAAEVEALQAPGEPGLAANIKARHICRAQRPWHLFETSSIH